MCRSSTCSSRTSRVGSIINIVADGVSDLALKRAEYQRVFTGGGIEGFIKDLDEQTTQLERK